MTRNYPTPPATPAALTLLIHGDIVVRHYTHRIVGTVDTVGGRYVNVVDRAGHHHPYRAEQLDVAA